jgi:hypothetical protein
MRRPSLRKEILGGCNAGESRTGGVARQQIAKCGAQNGAISCDQAHRCLCIFEKVRYIVDGCLHNSILRSKLLWSCRAPASSFYRSKRNDVIHDMKFRTHRFRVAKTATTTTTFYGGANIEPYLRTEANVQLQACDGCRRLKKKCSKTPPACELCISRGHICSLAPLPTAQNASSATPDDVEDTAFVSVNPGTAQEQNGMQLSSPRNSAATASTFDGTYLSYVHAYFRHVHRAYPFLDRQEILSNAKASTYVNVWADNPDSTVSWYSPASYSL